MKKILTLLAVAATVFGASAVDFDKYFADSTLRVDYVFGGTKGNAGVMLDASVKTPGWAGRRHHLDSTPLAGNGSVTVRNPSTGDTLYMNTFSSLFQEWLATDEAQHTPRSFENSFLVPLPKDEADIELTLYDNRRDTIARHTFRYSPADELVAMRGDTALPYVYLHRGADPAKAIDVAILAEGYRAEEMDSFLVHARRIADEILSYEPYASHRDRFNFVAVMSPSADSGVSIPLDRDWKNTAFGAHFSTFHSPRYLTVPRVHALHRTLEGIPYEHVMILVNTDRYGGGGIYNSYHISAARNALTLPVSVHEFGHSFGGLADEYFYDGEEDGTYPTDIEPWEPNISTLVDFGSKWKDMIAPGTPVPTPWTDKGGTREERMKEAATAGSPEVTGVYEGGGYRSHGVYRPAVTCRMRDNYYPSFCPVCRRAILRVIDFYTSE